MNNRKLTKEDKETIRKISDFYKSHPNKTIAKYQIERLGALYKRNKR